MRLFGRCWPTVAAGQRLSARPKARTSISRPEPPFDDGEVFVFAYGAILVSVRSHKLLGAQSAAQLTPGESAVVITIEFIKTSAAFLASSRDTVPS
jgi:hypothetical protein